VLSERDGNKYEIIGMFKDFNFASLHHPIEPMLIILDTQDQGEITYVRVRPGQMKHTIQAIEKQWKVFVSNSPFKYYFLDGNLDAQYRTEQQVGKSLTLFTILAIFIACLALFGLAAFTTQQRSKEISIRKVLWASMITVINLLSKDFLRLVLLANVIACPLAWYIINKWLQDFAYRIDIRLWVFVSAALLSIMIALFTIIFQALKAAHINPVDSLRNE
jgi:putative ABC transport system permease protein